MFNKTEVILIHQKSFGKGNEIQRQSSKSLSLNKATPPNPSRDSSTSSGPCSQIYELMEIILIQAATASLGSLQPKNSGKRARVLDFLTSFTIFQTVHLLRLTCV